MTNRKSPAPKIALALAGGGPLGAIYEIGALCALDEALEGLDFTGLHHYVGVSAGGFIAAGLANGMSPRELVQAIEKTEELIARLRALIRRASGNASAELTAGDIRLDTRSGKVTKDGEPVKLTAQEYKLLSYLLHHKGKVVSRTELIEHIYDQDFDRDSNTIEVFVTRIRKKLGPDVITTIRGLGYSLEDVTA